MSGIGHRGGNGRRGDEADARDRLQPPAGFACPVPSKKLGLDGLDLGLQFLELRHQRCQRAAGQGRNGILVGGAILEHLSDQFAEALGTLGGDETEFGEMTAQGIHRHRPLAHQQSPRPVEHQNGLLFRALNRNEAIVGRVTASQIASASAASFLPRLT